MSGFIGPHHPVSKQTTEFAPDRVEFALQYFTHLHRVGVYVQEHLHESVSLGDVATYVGLSPSRLSHLFREKTGICFRDWLAGQRVRKAKGLLQDSDWSITALARAVGYGNVRSLERAFKKNLGMTPRDFKKTVARHK